MGPDRFEEALRLVSRELVDIYRDARQGRCVEGQITALREYVLLELRNRAKPTWKEKHPVLFR